MKENNFNYLFAGLLILLLGAPIADEVFELDRPMFYEIAFVAVLAIGVWTLTKSKRSFRVGVVLAARERCRSKLTPAPGGFR